MSAPNVEPRVGSWWRPDGWYSGPWPAPYEEAFHGTDEEWEQAFASRGYEKLHPGGPEESDEAGCGYLVVRRHADHNVIETCAFDGSTVSVCFVAEPFVAACWATLIPSMVQAMAAAWSAEETRIIRRAIVAFVRHGHGGRVIEQNGRRDQDDVQRDNEIWRRQREQAAKKREAPDA